MGIAAAPDMPWEVLHNGIDFSGTYAEGALGDIAMARSNSKCASNMYFDLSMYKQDPQFESDSDYYLNSIEAAQNFYLSFEEKNWRFGFL